MLLPPRPLSLKPSFVWSSRLGGLALLLAGMGAAVGYGWWQWSEVEALLEQRNIWDNGVEAPGVRIGGEVTTHLFILNEYDLKVSFVDAHGATRQHDLEFNTLFSRVDDNSPVALRHLRDEPDKFAVSWAMDLTGSRWAAIAFMGVVGVGLIGGSLVFLGATVWRRLADADRVARRSEEVVAVISKVVPQMNKGRHTGNEFHFACTTGDGIAVSGKASFGVKHTPLHLDPEKLTLLALVSPEKPARPFLVRGDLHPFRFRDDERRAILEAVAAVAAPVPAQKPGGSPGGPATT
jgi:hypothetical protein